MNYKEIKKEISERIKSSKIMKKIPVELKPGEDGYVEGKRKTKDEWKWYGKYDPYSLEPIHIWMKYAHTEKDFILHLQKDNLNDEDKRDAKEALGLYQTMKKLNLISLAYDPTVPNTIRDKIMEFGMNKVERERTTGTDLIMQGADDKKLRELEVENSKLKTENHTLKKKVRNGQE